MAKKFFDQVWYRTQGSNAPLTAIPAITGTYPALTSISGFTQIVGAVADKQKIGLDADGKEAMADGTDYISSEKASVEIVVKNFTATQYGTLRTAFLNSKVDILLLDNEVRGAAYVIHGVILYPKIEVTGGEEPVLTITGERRAGTAATNVIFKAL